MNSLFEWKWGRLEVSGRYVSESEEAVINIVRWNSHVLFAVAVSFECFSMVAVTGHHDSILFGWKVNPSGYLNVVVPYVMLAVPLTK